MVLNRRYRRDLKANLSLYISTTFLTAVSLLMFYLYYIAGTGIASFGADFFLSQKVEDAHFSTYLPLSAEELSALEARYNCTLEQQQYINIKTDGVTARVFERTEKIDIPSISRGDDAIGRNDIVISEGYAQNNGIDIGDSVRIREREYTVTGFVLRPDYLYMLENLNDPEKNIANFFIAYMNAESFEALGEKNCQYLVRYSEDNSRAFRKDVNSRFFIGDYVARENNVRITMMEQQPYIFIRMSYAVLVAVPLVAVVLIGIVLSRKIKSERKMIGTLSAYGYQKRQIVAHYAGFAAIPGLIGGILTTVITLLCADGYGSLGLVDYEPMYIHFRLNAVQAVLGIVIPTLMYILSAVLIVNRLLRENTVSLLAGGADRENRCKKLLCKRKASLRVKFSLRAALGNPGRTFALFLGVLLGSFVTLFGLGMRDSINNLETAFSARMGNYNYQYICSELFVENTFGGETLLCAGAEDEQGTALSLVGADGNSLLGLKDTQGNAVSVGNDYVITSLYAGLTGLKTGDSFTLVNPFNIGETEVRVGAIIDDDFSKTVYTSRQNVAEITGIAAESFNSILSKDRLDIPEHAVRSVLDKSTVERQYTTVREQMNSMIVLFVGLGVALCVIAVYTAVNTVVNENRTNISMLRVLGYENRKIHRLLLNDHVFIALAAMLLSVPVTLVFGNALFRSFIDLIGYRIRMFVQPWTYFIAAAIVAAPYCLSTAWAARKIGKTDMAESLKDNRE